MIAEYLEHAIRFEQMAEQANDPKFKDSLLQQAIAYRKLAEQRAKKLNMALPPQSPQSASDQGRADPIK